MLRSLSLNCWVRPHQLSNNDLRVCQIVSDEDKCSLAVTQTGWPSTVQDENRRALFLDRSEESGHCPLDSSPVAQNDTLGGKFSGQFLDHSSIEYTINPFYEAGID